MASKNSIKHSRYINIEKYVFLLIIVFYITGLCCGCYYAFKSTQNLGFVKQIADVNAFEILLCFAVALAFKYAGILSCIIYILPLIAGIVNGANYCILYAQNSLSYSNILTILKDSAVVMLLILYIIVLISQIINKRFSLKKDLKYLYVYLCGVIIVLIIHYILSKIILYQAF